MIMTLDEVLPLVKLEDPLRNPVVIEGKERSLLGTLPIATEEGLAIMRKSLTTLGDLFFLEPPRTYADLKWRADQYKLNISLKFT